MSRWNKALEAVDKNPDSLELWEKLLEAIDNSGNIANDARAVRDVFDRLLQKFPLLYGYWLKYAELEQQAMKGDVLRVYERAVCAFPACIELWVAYLTHATTNKQCLFKRALAHCGRQFLSHDLWDMYLEFAPDDLESRQLLARLPLHQHARYYGEIESEGVKFDQVQDIVNARWSFESQLRRTYFHVHPVDLEDVDTWNSYLDFMEEKLGGEDGQVCVQDVRAVYEQCLIPCAFYDVVWLRYLRFAIRRDLPEEEIRNVFRRAALVFVPGTRPYVRQFWSVWEETVGNIDLARDILATLMRKLRQGTSLHNDTVIQRCYFEKRVVVTGGGGGDMKRYVDRSTSSPIMLAALANEYTSAESRQEREQLWESGWQVGGANSPVFISMWFEHCLADLSGEQLHIAWQRLVNESHVPPVQINDLSRVYMDVLDSSTNCDAMKWWIEVDSRINMLQITSENKRRLQLENGHVGVPIDQIEVMYNPLLKSPFDQLYKEQGLKKPKG